MPLVSEAASRSSEESARSIAARASCGCDAAGALESTSSSAIPASRGRSESQGGKASVSARSESPVSSAIRCSRCGSASRLPMASRKSAACGPLIFRTASSVCASAVDSRRPTSSSISRQSDSCSASRSRPANPCSTSRTSVRAERSASRAQRSESSSWSCCRSSSGPVSPIEVSSANAERGCAASKSTGRTRAMICSTAAVTERASSSPCSIR